MRVTSLDSTPDARTARISPTKAFNRRWEAFILGVSSDALRHPSAEPSSPRLSSGARLARPTINGTPRPPTTYIYVPEVGRASPCEAYRFRYGALTPLWSNRHQGRSLGAADWSTWERGYATCLPIFCCSHWVWGPWPSCCSCWRHRLARGRWHRRRP